MTTPAGTKRPSSARPRPGTPPAPPATDPALAEDPELAALRAEMRAEVEALRQERAAVAGRPAPQPQAPAPLPPAELPTAAADADIMGLPGVKPLRLTSRDENTPITRHPLFYIDGVAITVPDEVDMEIAVNYMRILEGNTEQSVVAGQSYLLHAMLGDDGYDRLAGFRGLTKAQLGWIISVCSRKALGQLENPKE